MIRKILLIILTIIVTSIGIYAYTPYIPKGTLIRVQPRAPITTENLEEGSIVYFTSPADIWVLEEKAVAKGDIFRGYVSTLKLPILGVNAALGITITNIIKTDGSRYDFHGKIIFADKDILGGNLTNPASYNTTIHPRKVYGNIWGGTRQYVPSGEYEFGSHVSINMRDNIFIQADEDYYF